MKEEYWWIADMIKQLRLERGLTQEELAEMADISVSHLSKIEAHIRVAGMETYLRIMKTLDAPKGEQLLKLAPVSERRMLRQRFWYLIEDCNTKEMRALLKSMEGVKKGLREINISIKDDS